MHHRSADGVNSGLANRLPTTRFGSVRLYDMPLFRRFRFVRKKARTWHYSHLRTHQKLICGEVASPWMPWTYFVHSETFPESPTAALLPSSTFHACCPTLNAFFTAVHVLLKRPNGYSSRSSYSKTVCIILCLLLGYSAVDY